MWPCPDFFHVYTGKHVTGTLVSLRWTRHDILHIVIFLAPRPQMINGRPRMYNLRIFLLSENGVIDFDEFHQLMDEHLKHGPDVKAELLDAFKAFDHNGEWS